MHVRHAPSPGEQRPNVPARLRALEPPERELRLGDLGVFGIVRGDHQEQARVGTALVELAGGVEVARAEAELGGTPERTSPGRTHGLKLGGDVRRGCEVREDRKVVARTGAPAQNVGSQGRQGRSRLRPYAAALCPLQLGARQRLRLLHVGLIERVHPQADAQFPRGILPGNARRTQRERLGRDIGHHLAIGILCPDGQVVSDVPPEPLALGAACVSWEYATWELCVRLGVNAFDQPDVEQAKALARAELEGAQGGGVGAQPAAPLSTLTPDVLRRSARPGDYLAILAYLAPTPDVTAKLQAVRAAWGRALGCATTLGFGPRYLHSTGQLHKGGPNTGLFLVVSADDAEDADIPEMGTTFGRLKRAQARGDIRALLARGRRVAHVHLARPDDVTRLA